jgi:hypothetical protein
MTAGKQVIGSKPVRYCAAAALFLLGVAALADTPNTEVFDALRETTFRWFLLLPAVLVLLAAYGVFRRLALARYSMYVLLVLNAAAIPLMVATSNWQWRWIIAVVICVAATGYVHLESKSAGRRQPAQQHWLREVGFMAIYFAAVALCVVGADLVHGPQVRTLSGPVSVAGP